MSQYKSVVVGAGTRLQSGIPKRAQRGGIGNGTGMLLRGVVTATYVLDDPTHPYADSTDAVPVAVYCDVLVYGREWRFIPNALVSQERSGIHSGHIWKPRAATMNITGSPMDLNKGTLPALLDGDHVLVGFLDGNTSLPIILRSLPHPSADVGNEELSTGHRLRLVDGDGDPDFWKHHGSFFGINDDGDLHIDTTHANDGELDGDGHEPDPPTDGKGAVLTSLPQDAEWRVQLMDMADPSAPVAVATIVMTKDGVEYDIADPAAVIQHLIDGGLCYQFEGKDGDAKLTLGDGAVAVAIADHLQTMWNQFVTDFGNHTHLDGFGGTGPVNSGPITAYDSSINSTKVTIPDG